MDALTPVQSPFLPGTYIQFAWDSTSLGYLKTCPRLYQYIMIDGWSPPGESIHLRFGQEVHSAFQQYDIDKANEWKHEDALRRTLHQLLIRTKGWEVDETTKAGKYKNRYSLVRTVLDYLDAYQRDPAETLIMSNGKPAVELSFRFELDWSPNLEGCAQHYMLCGHLDRVVTFQGFLYDMDYKTTTMTPGAYYFDQFSPNNQMTLYTLAGHVNFDLPIKGVIINAIQLLVEDTRIVRGMTYRTKDQLEEWLADLRFWTTLAESYANANYWPMNDTSCDKFGGCRFRDICSKSPQVRHQFLKSEFTKLPEEERWNPLKPR